MTGVLSLPPPLLLSLVDCVVKFVKYTIRIKDLLETNRKLEEKIAHLNEQMVNSIDTNKQLIDEHQALSTLYNSHERKLKESQVENDQLVSECTVLNTLCCIRVEEQGFKSAICVAT